MDVVLTICPLHMYCMALSVVDHALAERASFRVRFKVRHSARVGVRVNVGNRVRMIKSVIPLCNCWGPLQGVHKT